MKPPKPDNDSFDASKKFAGVGQQAGSVKSDKDWNTTGGGDNPDAGSSSQGISAGESGLSPNPKERRMSKGRIRWGFLGGGILVVLLLAAGSVWWFIRSQYPKNDAPPTSPVLVFMLTPSSGDEAEAGDILPVTLQAAAPKTISSAELFVDGGSMGSVVDSPENASWTWLAWPVGIHTFSAKATSSDGQIGQSQTVIVNVLAGDGFMQIPAEEGQTLTQVGEPFGVPPQEMADANPKLDPSLPLPSGQPVEVPAGEGTVDNLPAPPSGSPSGTGDSILIDWKFQPAEPVDKSYCYTSSGNEVWEKIPKEPFHFFFGGGQTQYPDYGLELLKEGETTFQAQCWGWLGEVLKFLGEGQTKYNAQQPDQVMISGAGFTLVGMPQFTPPIENFTGGGGSALTIPAPFALREPGDAADCTKHTGNPLLAGFVCDALLNATVKQYLVLEWEWGPEINWPGFDTWFNDIDGYEIYQIEPSTGKGIILKQINNPNQKMVTLPLPWGYYCYEVRAYGQNPSGGISAAASYCPGQPPTAQSMTIAPVDWLTTGGQWIQDGDCDTYGTGDAYLLANENSGFGNQPEVLVGSYIVDDDDEDCYREGNYSGGVKFGQFGLPQGAVLQKAVLSFSEIHTNYSADGVATNYTLFCASGVSTSKQDWSGQGGAKHFVGKNILSSAAYNSPYSSLSGWDDTPEVDVTSIVSAWTNHPEQNHGFILLPRTALYPATDGTGDCETTVGNFQLELFFFTP